MYQSQQSSTRPLDPGNAEIAAIAHTMMPKSMKFIESMVNIMIVVLGWLSMIVEAFGRSDFGERYWSYVRLYVTFWILFWWWVFFGGWLIGWLTLAFVGMALYHRVRIWLRQQNGIAWHSMSFGISHFEALGLPSIPVIGGGDWSLFRWYEPLFFGICGWLISQVDPSTGTLIFASAVALLVKNNIIYSQHRGRILDLIDAQIEGAYFNEKAFTKHKSEIAGIAPIQVVWPKNLPGGDGGFAQTVSYVMGEHIQTVAPQATPVADGAASGFQDAASGFAAAVADMLNPKTE